MPIGIVSDADFHKEFENSGIKVTKAEPKVKPVPESESVVIEDISRGRGIGRKEVPDEIREAAALASINGESAKDITRALGISASSLSAYKQGAHSTASYDSPNPVLLGKITNHKDKISKRATSTLLSALRGITSDKLAGVKPRDLAAIAKDMSAIIADMEPKTQVNEQQNNVQFVFMAPRVKEISEYQTITVNE